MSAPTTPTPHSSSLGQTDTAVSTPLSSTGSAVSWAPASDMAANDPALRVPRLVHSISYGSTHTVSAPDGGEAVLASDDTPLDAESATATPDVDAAPRFSRLLDGGLRISPSEEGNSSSLPGRMVETVTTRPWWITLATAGALALSLGWIVVCLFFAGQSMGWAAFGQLLPHEVGGMLAGALAPVALFWLAFGYALRADDARVYGEALRQELQTLIFPTEERNERISSDIQKLCDQASSLSESSRTLLKAMSATRQGIQQEIRSYLAMTQKTEIHFDQLAQGLQTKSKLVLQDVGELESRVSKINTTVDLVMSGWHEASQQVIKGADGLEERFTVNVQKIIQAAETAHDRTTALEQNIRGRFDGMVDTVSGLSNRLTDVGAQFETQAGTLKRATDSVGVHVDELGRTIETNVLSFERITHSAAETMARSSQMLIDQREQLNSGIERLVEQSQTLANTLGVKITDIQRSADELGTRADRIDLRLTQQSDRIAGAVKGMTDQAVLVEQAGDVTVNKMAEALSMALSGADQISAAVQQSVASIDRVRRQAFENGDDFMQSAAREIERLTALVTSYRAQVDACVGALRSIEQGMTGTLNDALSRIDTTENRLQDKVEALAMTGYELQDRLTATLESMEKPVQVFENHIVVVNKNFAAINETLDKRIVLLREAADHALAQADVIHDRLKGQSMELSSTTGQITAHLRSVEQQLNSERMLVAKTVEDGNRQFDSFAVRLRDMGRQLGDTASDVDLKMGQIDDRLGQQVALLSGQVQGALGSVGHLSNQLQGLAGQINDHVGTLSGRLITALDDVGSAGDDAQTILEQAIKRADEMTLRLERVQDGCRIAADSSISSVDRAADRLDHVMQTMDREVHALTHTLNDSGDQLVTKVESIKLVSDAADDALLSVQRGIEKRAQDLHLLSDQVTLKSDSLQKTLDAQFAELARSAGTAMEQLREAGECFTGTARTVSSGADQAVMSLQSASRLAEGETSKLRHAVDVVLDHTKSLVASLEREAAELLRSTSLNLQDIKKIGDAMEIRSREVDEHLKSSLQTSQNYTQQAREQAARVALSAREASQDVSDAIGALENRAQAVIKMVTSVEERIAQACSTLDQQATLCGEAADRSHSKTDEASQFYQRQASALMKASQDAQGQLDRLRDVQLRAQRETFLTSARFVLETLHSLSVDFSRTLDVEGQDRLWKAYQKGDVAAFTRRLVEMGDQFPKDRVSRKYVEDQEFRAYAQKYFRLFEDLLDQSTQTDGSDMLNWTFLTSDAGRLYTLMGTVLGRNVREIKELVKAT